MELPPLITSAVELIASDNWLIEGKALVPADEGRLLIVMAIEENRLSVRSGSLDIDVDEGRFIGVLDELEGGTFNVLLLGPVEKEFCSLLKKSVGVPLRVVVVRLVGDANVVLESRQDLVRPLLLHPSNCCR